MNRSTRVGATIHTRTGKRKGEEEMVMGEKIFGSPIPIYIKNIETNIVKRSETIIHEIYFNNLAGRKVSIFIQFSFLLVFDPPSLSFPLPIQSNFFILDYRTQTC